MEKSFIKGIHHVCIKVHDIGESINFYTQKMGYEVRFQSEQCAMLNAPDGTRLEFFPEDNEKGYVHIAYDCNDVDGMFQLAVESGCKAVKMPTDVKLPAIPPIHARIAFFKDPEGNTIELFHE